MKEYEYFASADAIYICIGDAGDEQFSLTDLMPPGTTDNVVMGA